MIAIFIFIIFKILQKKVQFVSIQHKNGFSLIELLAVVAIIAILASLAIPAFNAIGQSQNFDSQVSDFQQLFDDSRAYAMANNTYVLIGIEEVDAANSTAAVPQTAATATAGGRIAVAVCGTTNGLNGMLFSGANCSIDQSHLVAIHTLRLFPNLHLQYLTATVPLSSPLANRYSVTAGTGAQDSTLLDPSQMLGYPSTLGATFTWPLNGAVQYTFNRVVDFGPDGSAFFVPTSSATGTTPPPRWLELALQETISNRIPPTPTAGTLVTGKAGQQVAAIQIDGITGTSQLYRQ